MSICTEESLPATFTPVPFQLYLTVRLGEKFDPVAVTVTDSPAQVTGYSIIKASSLDDATEKAKGCPVLGGGAKVMVFETFPAM